MGKLCIIGGPAGAAIGEFLNNLGALPDKDSHAPPPKHPFPWANEQDSSKSSEKKPPAIKKNDSALEQLLKVFSN